MFFRKHQHPVERKSLSGVKILCNLTLNAPSQGIKVNFNPQLMNQWSETQ
jgi:hypothetical protein